MALDLARRLARLGFNVTRVTSGAAAVDTADTLRPALVFMDVHLPGAVDGLHAAASIWAQQRIPIICPTGDAESALLDGAQTPPPVFALFKPFTKMTLQETLSEALAACSDGSRL